jgi:hypothetical protein
MRRGMPGINSITKKWSADSDSSGNVVAVTGVKGLKAEDAMNIGVKITLQAILFEYGA